MLVLSVALQGKERSEEQGKEEPPCLLKPCIQCLQLLVHSSATLREKLASDYSFLLDAFRGMRAASFLKGMAKPGRVMTEPGKRLESALVHSVMPAITFFDTFSTCFHTQLHSFFMVMWNLSTVPRCSWFAYCLLLCHSSLHLAVE